MEKNITLASNACSKPFIIIRFHDLHASNIKKAMGEIISYHERDWLSPFFLVFASYVSFGLCLAFLFCLPCDGSGHQSFIGLFCAPSCTPFPLLKPKKEQTI